MVVRVSIEPRVLAWAIDRTGLTITDLSERSDFKNIQSWMDGDLEPTVKQAEKLAAQAQVPFPYLLLESPVQEGIDLPDFRTVRSVPVTEASPELEITVQDCRGRLDWYVEYAREMAIDSPNSVGRFGIDDDPITVARNFSNEIGWEAGRYSLGDRAVSELSDFIENLGVLVMRSSMVRNNSRRPLDPEEFRGFAMIDRGFALIFVNARDSKSAQLFSLAHEFAHVLLGEPGVSGQDLGSSSGVEPWCNRFAAEFLIPAEFFAREWRKFDRIEDAVLHISSRLGVSPEATIWRGVNLSYIGEDESSRLVEQLSYRGPKKQPGGGDGIRNMRPRLGKRFLNAAASVVGTDLLPVREAMYLMGVRKHETLLRLAGHAGEAA